MIHQSADESFNRILDQSINQASITASKKYSRRYKYLKIGQSDGCVHSWTHVNNTSVPFDFFVFSIAFGFI